MTEEKTPEEIVEIAINLCDAPTPLAPYWEERNFAQGLGIPLNREYTPEQWDWIFARFIKLVNSEDWIIREQAIDRIKTALEAEKKQSNRVAERLPDILQAIAYQATLTPDIFEEFCNEFQWFSKDEPYNSLIFHWLEQLAGDKQRQLPSDEAIEAAKIYFYGYGETWTQAGAKLIAALDHPDLTIRACAAYQIGKIYSRTQQYTWDDDEDLQIKQQIAEGMPPIQEMMQLIRQKELERPGIAGAFGHVCPRDNINLDYGAWILDILENSQSPEPYIIYFPCNLAFDAHERFSHDADAILRLIQMGRVDIAIAAATDEDRKIEALKPLLIEMGDNEDPEIVRRVSWHLAYYYHYLHSKGVELGYVELIADLSEIDLFLLFSGLEARTSPYAAIIYAKGQDKLLSQTISTKWVDKIFPNSVRGEIKNQRYLDSLWFTRGYIKYQGNEENEKKKLWDNVIIGYRSNAPWNPKEFL
ncbi:hypothetical protein [Nostoc sp. 'Peltigera membranacea cyanobiont' N6]|uniref:hypothetical protein n=1 Tax=Nostoc sp. 'Peltigera membranacea cyanobiont' N6 TaxID=1261031 RepID=UPI000CF339A1|nr:hypothetical protein [Nostoc sp. 'Peltigera membranacea cyanobiont' N6]AVH65130.1 hypothetical protein NPM_3539 [Nostoc sp. 'Peltigera membranacea cyanobiont' N6]